MSNKGFDSFINQRRCLGEFSDANAADPGKLVNVMLANNAGFSGLILFSLFCFKLTRLFMLDPNLFGGMLINT
jgi:hypothetical protein